MLVFIDILAAPVMDYEEKLHLYQTSLRRRNVSVIALIFRLEMVQRTRPGNVIFYRQCRRFVENVYAKLLNAGGAHCFCPL